MKRPVRHPNPQYLLTFETPIEIDLDEETRKAVICALASMLIEAMSETPTATGRTKQ